MITTVIKIMTKPINTNEHEWSKYNWSASFLTKLAKCCEYADEVSQDIIKLGRDSIKNSLSSYYSQYSILVSIMPPLLPDSGCSHGTDLSKESCSHWHCSPEYIACSRQCRACSNRASSYNFYCNGE